MARKKIEEAVATRPASAERGEISLTLDGGVYVLRPTFEAIEAFEDSTGKGLQQLAREGIEGALRTSEVAMIACECIRAWGRATGSKSAAGVNSRRVGELLLEAEGGVIGAQRVVAGVLAMASTGGYTALGEPKAGATTTTTSAALAGN
jgi:hypothetical protein